MKRGMTLAIAVLGVLSMAPTSGDIGGCGREATALDVGVFARARKSEDCNRCVECRIDTARCARACDPEVPPETVLPPTCHPLQHDGEVCIRALRAVSCGTFETYVADVGAKSPSECAFCRIGVPGSSASLSIDEDEVAAESTAP